MIIWEYLKWAWRQQVPQLVFKCLLAMIASVTLTLFMILSAWFGGVLFASFARGFFWAVKLWADK